MIPQNCFLRQCLEKPEIFENTAFSIKKDGLFEWFLFIVRFG